MKDKEGFAPFIGGDIWGLITSGMYDNPLAVYREYIQNAADALSTVGNGSLGQVRIKIDPSSSSVSITDNGPGLSKEAAVRALLPVARSQKRQGTDRGFRGIGRLSGLAFADSVSFFTRTRHGDPVTRVVWDGTKLRERVRQHCENDRVIHECVEIETLPGSDYPANFFEVRICGVGRHAASRILNRVAVRDYIADICPVPISTKFPYASRVITLFEQDTSPLTLDIVLDDEESSITRRYGDTIRLSKEREDTFTDFEEIYIPSADGNGIAAIGWIGHSSYLGAIPKETGIRGIRARVGNIQVGDESAFEHLFPEERFNRWCIGEIHVLDSRIVPNGRRDYFEPGPHIRNLENHLGAVFRRTSARCRKASTTRNNNRKLYSVLCQLEETYELAVSGYLAPEDASALVVSSLSQFAELRNQMLSMNGRLEITFEQLEAVGRKLENFQAGQSCTPLSSISTDEAAIYRRVFRTLVAVSPSPRTAKDIMEAVLTQT